MAVKNQPIVGVLPTTYLNKTFTPVPDKIAFFRTNVLPEYLKIKLMMERAKQLFHLPDDKVKLEVVADDRIYKIIFSTPDAKKQPFGFLIYIPLEQRLDVFDGVNLYLQFKNNKAVFKNFSFMLSRLNLENIFLKLIN